MAIIPSDAYTGQTDTSDLASYPYGAAQNVSVPGDASGTPLEKTWVNDLWGFLQAALRAGGIVPSGIPDKVGASQYLQALAAIPWLWTGDQQFAQTILVQLSAYFAGPLVLQGVANEVVYAPARTRTIMLCLDQSVPTLTQSDARNSCWSSNGADMHTAGSGPYYGRRWPFRLPHGAQLLGVKAGVYLPPGGANLTMTVRRLRAELSSPYAGAATDLAADTHAGSGAGQLFDSGPLGTVVNGALDTFAIDIDPSALAQSVRFIAVTFSDPGPRNY